MSDDDFTVVSDLNKYTENILYAVKIRDSSDDALSYSLNLLSEPNFSKHQEKMDYLKQYIFSPAIKELIGGVEKRVNEFKKSINGPDI